MRPYPATAAMLSLMPSKPSNVGDVIYIFKNTQIFQNISEDAKVRGQRYLTNRQICLQNISSEIIYYSKYFQGAGAVPAGACVLRQ